MRVKPDAESVSLAAQTLGKRTMDAEQLKELVQGRFVDALSNMAAQDDHGARCRTAAANM